MQYSLPATDTATHPAARQMGATKQQKGQNMKNTLVITIKKIDGGFSTQLNGDKNILWGKALKKIAPALIDSLEQQDKETDNDEAKAREEFIETVAKETGRTKEDVQKELDESDDEKATALRLMGETLMKTIKRISKEEGKKDE